MENQGGRLLAMMKKTVLLMITAGFLGSFFSRLLRDESENRCFGYWRRYE